MERVLIIGCPGAGKSTFARQLRKKTGLPLYYLDLIWHRPDHTNCSREEFDEEFRQWILDFPNAQHPLIHEKLKQYAKTRNI